MGEIDIREVTSQVFNLTNGKIIKPFQRFLWKQNSYYTIEDKLKSTNSEACVLNMHNTQLCDLVHHIQDKENYCSKKVEITIQERRSVKLKITFQQNNVDFRLWYIQNQQAKPSSRGFSFTTSELENVVAGIKRAQMYVDVWGGIAFKSVHEGYRLLLTLAEDEHSSYDNQLG